MTRYNELKQQIKALVMPVNFRVELELINDSLIIVHAFKGNTWLYTKKSSEKDFDNVLNDLLGLYHA